MENLKILNKKESEKIVDMLREQYGFSGELDYVFLRSIKNNIYIVNKEIGEIALDKMRINSIGLYFGELNGSQMRLSIEGTQLIGKECSKNVIEVDFQKKLAWLKGEDISVSDGEDTFKLLKEGNDYIGCGKQKNGKILNYVPKNRRLNLTGEYFE